RRAAVDARRPHASLLPRLFTRCLDRLFADGGLDVFTADGRPPDREVDEHFGTKVLANIDDRFDRLGSARRKSCVLEVFGPDAEDDALAFEGFDRVSVNAQAVVAEARDQTAVRAFD